MTAAALLSLSAGALADGTYEFASITRLTNPGYSITGLLVNDTVPTTLVVYAVQPVCFSWLELMMKSPGVYNLSVTLVTSSMGLINISSCILEVKP